MYERIKASRTIPAHNLPLSPTPFIGREEEFAEIRRYLANQDCRLLTVVGLGGIGKSRLAWQAAGSVAADTARFFLHGVWFIFANWSRACPWLWNWPPARSQR